MILIAMFRDAFDAIRTEYPELTVPVVIGGVSGTGTKATFTDSLNLTDDGESGISSGIVRVSAAEFRKPTKGEIIIVDGAACFSGDVRTDGVGAFYIIPYQVQNPITGTGSVI